MTKKKLIEKLQSVRQTGYGHWRVTFEHRGRQISCTTTNSMAIDAMDAEDGQGPWFKTQRQAMQALYDECKQANNLN